MHTFSGHMSLQVPQTAFAEVISDDLLKTTTTRGIQELLQWNLGFNGRGSCRKSKYSDDYSLLNFLTKMSLIAGALNIEEPGEKKEALHMATC